jgi:enoyl-CoA hydratase
MPDYSQFKEILARRDGRLLTLSFNRPEEMNTLGTVAHRELFALIAMVRGDDSVGAVLLRGEGDNFCGGGDLREMPTEELEPSALVSVVVDSKEILYSFLEIDQPIVAAVQGIALGLGATIALCCDVVVAAEDAYFADNHIDMGLVAGDGGAVLWPLLLPFGQAKYHLLTGDRISGSEAARMGMVHAAVPADHLLDEATTIARRLADGPTLALKWTKRTVNRVLRKRLDLMLEVGLALEGATFLSNDFREASLASLEKRKPNFTGR